MRTLAITAASFVLGAVVAGSAFSLAAGMQALPGQFLRTSQTVTGQTIEVPAHPDVIAAIVTIPAGGRTPVHKHPYQRYVYILAGSLDVSTAPGKGAMPTIRHYKPGDFLPEMRDQWHFGVNAGHDEVKLLVIDQVPSGTPANMVMQGQ